MTEDSNLGQSWIYKGSPMVSLYQVGEQGVCLQTTIDSASLFGDWDVLR